MQLVTPISFNSNSEWFLIPKVHPSPQQPFGLTWLSIPVSEAYDTQSDTLAQMTRYIFLTGLAGGQYLAQMQSMALSHTSIAKHVTLIALPHFLSRKNYSKIHLHQYVIMVSSLLCWVDDSNLKQSSGNVSLLQSTLKLNSSHILIAIQMILHLYPSPPAMITHSLYCAKAD